LLTSVFETLFKDTKLSNYSFKKLIITVFNALNIVHRCFWRTNEKGWFLDSTF